MTTRLVSKIDTSGEDTVSISFISINKNGITGQEKMLTSELIQSFPAIKGFPKIAGLVTGDAAQQAKKPQ